MAPLLLDGSGALTADFQQYYALDLEGLLDDAEFSRIAVLARELPTSSRSFTRIDPRGAWDEKAYLLALMADNLSFMRYENSGGRGRKPKPVERPKGREPKRRLDVAPSRRTELLFGLRR